MKKDGGEPTVDLSVVIPAHNAAATIADQIDALRSQAWSGTWDVNIVDNGSSDETAQIVRAAIADDARFQLIDGSARQSASFARNLGVQNSRGASLAFCDADDVVADGWLAAMGEALAKWDFVTGPQEMSELNPQWLRGAFGETPSARLQTFADIFPFGPTANLGIRRHVFEEVGGFDESIAVYEDLDLCRRVWENGHILRYEPACVVHYRMRSDMSALWKQAVSYGRASPFISANLKRAGHPTPARMRGAKNVIWLTRKLPTLRRRSGRARWVVVAGTLVGRAHGSIQNRYLQL